MRERPLSIEPLCNLREFTGSIAFLITLIQLAIQTRETDYATPHFARVMDDCDRRNPVLYDPDTRSWMRPYSGRFAKDAE